MALLNRAAVNVGVQRPLQDSDFISFGQTPRSGIAGSHGGSIVNFLRNPRAVSHSGWTSAIPPAVLEGSPFSTSSSFSRSSFGRQPWEQVRVDVALRRGSPSRGVPSAAFHALTRLHRPPPERAHPAKPKPCAHETAPHPSRTQALATTLLLPASLSLTALGNSHESDHPVCILL